MQEVIIDCAEITCALQLHGEFARSLGFSDWYGSNLDALYDCLTAIGQETRICLRNWEVLDQWKKGFACVLADACEANPRLQVIWEN